MDFVYWLSKIHLYRRFNYFFYMIWWKIGICFLHRRLWTWFYKIIKAVTKWTKYFVSIDWIYSCLLLLTEIFRLCFDNFTNLIWRKNNLYYLISLLLFKICNLEIMNMHQIYIQTNYYYVKYYYSNSKTGLFKYTFIHETERQQFGNK